MNPEAIKIIRPRGYGYQLQPFVIGEHISGDKRFTHDSHKGNVEVIGFTSSTLGIAHQEAFARCVMKNCPHTFIVAVTAATDP